MEDGRLTDSKGRTVSFKDTLLILTSNIGSHIIAAGGHRPLGFDLAVSQPGEHESAEDVADAHEDASMHALVLEEFKAFFRPEMLNRLDEIVVRTLRKCVAETGTFLPVQCCRLFWSKQVPATCAMCVQA